MSSATATVGATPVVVADAAAAPVRRRLRKQPITLREINELKSFSLHEASTKLGVSKTTFKKCCRSVGLKRWPVRSVNKKQTKFLKEMIKTSAPSDIDEFLTSVLQTDVDLIDATGKFTSIGSANNISGTFKGFPKGVLWQVQSPCRVVQMADSDPSAPLLLYSDVQTQKLVEACKFFRALALTCGMDPKCFDAIETEYLLPGLRASWDYKLLEHNLFDGLNKTATFCLRHVTRANHIIDDFKDAKKAMRSALVCLTCLQMVASLETDEARLAFTHNFLIVMAAVHNYVEFAGDNVGEMRSLVMHYEKNLLLLEEETFLASKRPETRDAEQEQADRLEVHRAMKYCAVPAVDPKPAAAAAVALPDMPEVDPLLCLEKV